MKRITALLQMLPEATRDQLQDEGAEVWAIYDATVDYIQELHDEMEDLYKDIGEPRIVQDLRSQVDALDKVHIELLRKNHQLKEENARMLKVLTAFGETVTSYHDYSADLDFKCDQGSESREFDRGSYCGRTGLANKLMDILMEKK